MEPISIRFAPSERMMFETAAFKHGELFTPFMRRCALMGLKYLLANEAMEDYIRPTSVIRGVGQA